MKNKAKGGCERFIRSDGWVVSPDGMKRLKEGGYKGRRLADESLKRQVGTRHRVTKPLDRDAAAILSSVKGIVARTLFVSNAIMAEVERREKEGIDNGKR